MKWTLLTWTLWSLTACGERGSGDYAFDSRRLEPFSEVENRGEANIYLSVENGADDGEITVTGDDNLIGDVRTWVHGDTLVVETTHDLWPSHELRVVAAVSRVARIDNDGSGDVHADGAEGDFLLVVDGSGDATVDGDLDLLEVICDGGGDAHLDGSADRLEIAAEGSGDVEARDLRATDADVRVSGSGDVEVCVTGTLDASTSGSGDIDYYCNPDVVYPSTSGSGDIRGH